MNLLFHKIYLCIHKSSYSLLESLWKKSFVDKDWIRFSTNSVKLYDYLYLPYVDWASHYRHMWWEYANTININQIKYGKVCQERISIKAMNAKINFKYLIKLINSKTKLSEKIQNSVQHISTFKYEFT